MQLFLVEQYCLMCYRCPILYFLQPNLLSFVYGLFESGNESVRWILRPPWLCCLYSTLTSTRNQVSSQCGRRTLHPRISTRKFKPFGYRRLRTNYETAAENLFTSRSTNETKRRTVTTHDDDCSGSEGVCLWELGIDFFFIVLGRRRGKTPRKMATWIRLRISPGVAWVVEPLSTLLSFKPMESPNLF